MKREKLMLVASLLLVFAPTVAMTDDVPTLKEIMQGLRDDLVAISDGLLTDDFEQVTQGAHSIANHPQIAPAQVQLVAAALGQEMPSFKQLDVLVHNQSLEISAAARSLDRDGAIAAYQRMIQGCFDCHHTYKERVSDALSSGCGGRVSD